MMGRVGEADGMAPMPADAPPMPPGLPCARLCAGCNLPIGDDPYVCTKEHVTLHQVCFVCAECKKPLDVSSYGTDLNGRFYCAQHLKSARLSDQQDRTLASGWLMKEGNIRKSWRRRFFVLPVNSTELRYYSSEQAAPGSEKGVIDLTAVTMLQPDYLFVPPDRKAPDAPSGSLPSLQLVTPKRVWNLACDTDATRKAWLDAIRTVQARCESASPAASRGAAATRHSTRSSTSSTSQPPTPSRTAAPPPTPTKQHQHQQSTSRPLSALSMGEMSGSETDLAQPEGLAAAESSMSHDSRERRESIASGLGSLVELGSPPRRVVAVPASGQGVPAAPGTPSAVSSGTAATTTPTPRSADSVASRNSPSAKWQAHVPQTNSAGARPSACILSATRTRTVSAGASLRSMGMRPGGPLAQTALPDVQNAAHNKHHTVSEAKSRQPDDDEEVEEGETAQQVGM